MTIPPPGHRVALAYTAGWVSICLLAAKTALRKRAGLGLFSRDYALFLFRPWKLATFALSGGSLVLLAPCAGDPSWDRVDALFMSVLTFATAPWAVGVLRSFRRGQADRALADAALCVGLFSSTWSYDLYLYCRDGVYPATWLGNLFVGPALYAAAGVFWSLEPREGLARVAPVALGLAALAAAVFAPYLWPALLSALLAR